MLQSVESCATKLLTETPGEEKSQRGHSFNWWRATRREVEWLVGSSGFTSDKLRDMNRRDFQSIVRERLWKDEWRARVTKMRSSVRLAEYGEHLETRLLRDPPKKPKWTPASHLCHLGNRYHAQLVSKCRLGLLPVEVETGRWQRIPIPREGRVCEVCRQSVGTGRHFAEECTELKGGVQPGLWASVMSGRYEHGEASCRMTGKQWRETAGVLESRWRQRQTRLKGDTSTEPVEEEVEDEWDFGDDAATKWYVSGAEEARKETRIGQIAAESYTDGSGRKVDGGCVAGWGVCTVFAGHDGHEGSAGRIVREDCGPVVVDAKSDDFLGADVGSNNTGELTGIAKALDLVIEGHTAWEGAAVIIRYDSYYAANVTTGLWKAKRNVRLVETVQRKLAKAAKVQRVLFMHVKAHAGTLGNEAADRLAKRGSEGRGHWCIREATPEEEAVEFGKFYELKQPKHERAQRRTGRGTKTSKSKPARRTTNKKDAKA